MKNQDLIKKTVDVLSDLWNDVDYIRWDLLKIYDRIEKNEFDDVVDEDVKDLEDILAFFDSIHSDIASKLYSMEDDLPDGDLLEDYFNKD